MWRFIIQQNIERYRRLLDTETDTAKVDVLRLLLSSAEIDLVDIGAASTRFPTSSDVAFAVMLQRSVDFATNLVCADFGTLHVFDPLSGLLLMAAQRNFRTPLLQHFAAVAAGDGSTYGDAKAQGERVMIEDIDDAPAFLPHASVARAAGFRAVQSTPVFTPSGEVIGVLSTHFAMPRGLSGPDQIAMDRHAAVVAYGLSTYLPPR